MENFLDKMEFDKEMERINDINKKYEKKRQKDIEKTLKWAEKVFKDFKREKLWENIILSQLAESE